MNNADEGQTNSTFGTSAIQAAPFVPGAPDKSSAGWPHPNPVHMNPVQIHVHLRTAPSLLCG